MMCDIWRFTGNVTAEALTATVTRPSDWRGYACTLGGILGLPVVPMLMAAPFVHFIREPRFNRDLLHDLIPRPEVAARLAPSLAA